MCTLLMHNETFTFTTAFIKCEKWTMTCCSYLHFVISTKEVPLLNQCIHIHIQCMHIHIQCMYANMKRVKLWKNWDWIALVFGLNCKWTAPYIGDVRCIHTATRHLKAPTQLLLSIFLSLQQQKKWKSLLEDLRLVTCLSL